MSGASLGQPLLPFICALQAFLASEADIPELSDCCLAMHSFIDCLLAVCVPPIVSRWCGEEAADGLVPCEVGASVLLLDESAREGPEVELGEVEVGSGCVALCAMTSAVGAIETKAANSNARRGLINLSR